MVRSTALFIATCLVAEGPRSVYGFGVQSPSSQRRLSTSVLRAEDETSVGYSRAAELRVKAEDAKRKAEELKKIAEQKAEAAMEAVKRANKQKEEAPAVVAGKSTVPPEPTITKKASTVSVDASEALVPVNRENIEFTSGVVGGAVALALGASPPLAIVAAVAANYISRKDDLGEANEFIQAISSASLNTLNWLGNLDEKYSLLGKLTGTLEGSIDKLKNSQGQDTVETVTKIEETISRTSQQISQLATDIDLIEGGKQALGAVGDVLETSIDKAVDANNEYKLTERAGQAAKKAVEKIQESN